MKAVAARRCRFGYRRIHVMLQRQGIAMNIKKLSRLYAEDKLQVRKRGARKRALGTRRPINPISGGTWTLSAMLSPMAGGSGC